MLILLEQLENTSEYPMLRTISQLTFPYSKPTIETLQKGKKYVQS